MEKHTKLIALGVVVIAAGAFLLASNEEVGEESEIVAIEDTVTKTKFGDFNIGGTISAKEVEIGQSFTVTISVTDQTPDLINAIATGDPAEYERYKAPWTMEGIIDAAGPVNPKQVFVVADKAEQNTDPEDIPFGSVFTRTGVFTCTDKGGVVIDLDYLLERKIDDLTPPINPTLDLPRASEEVLYLGGVDCVEKKKKKKKKDPPEQGAMVQIPPPYLIICPEGGSLSGHPVYDIETIEPILDSVGNYINRDTGKSAVCPGGTAGSFPPEAGNGIQKVGEKPEGAS